MNNIQIFINILELLTQTFVTKFNKVKACFSYTLTFPDQE